MNAFYSSSTKTYFQVGSLPWSQSQEAGVVVFAFSLIYIALIIETAQSQ